MRLLTAISNETEETNLVTQMNKTQVENSMTDSELHRILHAFYASYN